MLSICLCNLDIRFQTSFSPYDGAGRSICTWSTGPAASACIEIAPVRRTQEPNPGMKCLHYHAYPNLLSTALSGATLIDDRLCLAVFFARDSMSLWHYACPYAFVLRKLNLTGDAPQPTLTATLRFSKPQVPLGARRKGKVSTGLFFGLAFVFVTERRTKSRGATGFRGVAGTMNNLCLSRLVIDIVGELRRGQSNARVKAHIRGSASPCKLFGRMNRLPLVSCRSR